MTTSNTIIGFLLFYFSGGHTDFYYLFPVFLTKLLLTKVKCINPCAKRQIFQGFRRQIDMHHTRVISIRIGSIFDNCMAKKELSCKIFQLTRDFLT